LITLGDNPADLADEGTRWADMWKYQKRQKNEPSRPSIFDAERAPERDRRWRITVPVVVIVLIGAVLTATLWPHATPAPVAGPDYCDPKSHGLIRMDGKCIGVTDGSYVLMPDLKREHDQIAAQNAAIGTKRSVTVAVFNPLTPDLTSSLDINEIRHQLQGVIVAQKRINEDPANNLRVRIVLANEGGHQTHWQPVVEQLRLMMHDPSPLVAAIGMGITVQSTLDAALKLSDYKIPAIGAIATADDLNQAKMFFRVLPAVRDHVDALRPWAARYKSALMVYDTASDDPRQPDLFTRSLRNDFREQLGDLFALPSVGYHGEENSKDVLPVRFGRIREKVCNARIPLVLFAGRRNDLGRFVSSLEQRDCAKTTPVTVMIGGTDLGGLVPDPRKLKETNITLVWSAKADIKAWTRHRGAPAHFGEFYQAYRSSYRREDLSDGEALVGHDALLVVARAAQAIDNDDSADAASDDPNRALPSGANVAEALLDTHALEAIHGAGGELSYEQRADGTSGDPIGKLIPVLQQGRPMKPPPVDVYVTQ
jgi:ABC-type branched-subunit amino acid transport system substrate-binding protein